MLHVDTGGFGSVAKTLPYGVYVAIPSANKTPEEMSETLKSEYRGR